LQNTNTSPPPLPVITTLLKLFFQYKNENNQQEEENIYKATSNSWVTILSNYVTSKTPTMQTSKSA
jgi:hypothetical protein